MKEYDYKTEKEDLDKVGYSKIDSDKICSIDNNWAKLEKQIEDVLCQLPAEMDELCESLLDLRWAMWNIVLLCEKPSIIEEID